MRYLSTLKTTLFLTFGAIVVVGFALPGKAAGQEAYVGKYEPIEGFYTLRGKIPAEFKTIDYLEMRHGREEFPTYGSIKLKGKRGANYLLLLPVFDDKNVSLKTKKAGGVSYEFTGAFTRLNLQETSDPDSTEIVLTGTLKKLRAGKVIATMDAQFSYYWGT